MTSKQLKNLTWWDIMILTVILFGQPIFNSTIIYLSEANASTDVSSFTGNQDYQMILSQGLTLLVAFGYLFWRRFDFSRWRFEVNGRAVLTAIALFLVLAGLMDLFYWIFDPVYRSYFSLAAFNPAGFGPAVLGSLSVSRVLYALLNGFYEEIYFIGLCLSVTSDQRRWVWLFSILVRISFHTYQGLLPALGIGLILGIAYYVWYDKLGKANLFPIVLSHALADIWGLAILYYWFLG